MYAIIRDGGHQYHVEIGQRVRVQLRDAKPGAVVTFKDVCLLSTRDDEAKIGKPFVAGASVEGKVVQAEMKAKKVIILKYRRRKNSQRRNCHRQRYTEVEITGIKG
jgi:large subunit ribosomal protein L21